MESCASSLTALPITTDTIQQPPTGMEDSLEAAESVTTFVSPNQFLKAPKSGKHKEGLEW